MNVPSRRVIRVAFPMLLGGLMGIALAASGCRGAGSSGETASETPDSAAAAPYVCRLAPGTITIDGKLDDPAWSSAPWTADFVDVRGEGHPAPHLRTRAKMLWDGKHLYVAAKMQDPHVWGTMTKKGSHLFQENNFELFLDPQNNARDYWELEINPLNTTWDLQMNRPHSMGGGEVPGVAIKGLRTAVHVRGTLNNPADQDKGWTTEIAIPLASLTKDGHTPRDGEQWGILMSRMEWELDVVDGRYQKRPKGEHYWSSVPTGKINFHMPEKYQKLRFSAEPAPSSAPSGQASR